MGRAAKLRRARREAKSNRPSIPDYDALKPVFSSDKLKNWLIEEWDLCLDFKLFVQHYDKQLIASAMLEQLYSELNDSCNHDSRVEYRIEPYIKLAVGVNVYTWTVWAFVGNEQLMFTHHTPDDEEFDLKSCLA